MQGLPSLESPAFACSAFDLNDYSKSERDISVFQTRPSTNARSPLVSGNKPIGPRVAGSLSNGRSHCSWCAAIRKIFLGGIESRSFDSVGLQVT